MSFRSCLNCQDREVGCHATCEKYHKEKAEHDRVMANKHKDNLFRSYASDRIGEFKEKAAKNPRYYKGKL